VETSTSSTVDSRSVGVVGLDEDSTYHSPSVLAIVSLCLGIISPVALFAPLLLALAIAGILIGLLALRQISTSDGALIGRSAALWGVGLSIVAIAAVFTRSAVNEQLLTRQAKAAAEEWFALLQSGESEQAFELTTASRQGPPKVPPGAPEPETPPVSPLDTFRADPVVHFLLEHADGKPVKFVRTEIVDPADVTNARIQQLYEVDVPAEVGSRQSTTIEVILQRVRGYGANPAQWLVAAHRSDELPPPEEHDHHAGHAH
jgi:hypothetical protein